MDNMFKIDEIVSVQTEHVLRNDRTVLHERRLYQVTDKTRAKQVVVCEYLNGRMAIKYGKQQLAFKSIDQRPLKVALVKKVKRLPRYVPPVGSYWRNGFKLKGSLRNF